MGKICWRCGAPHDDGVRVCPNCGATFASEEEVYHSDGRTVAPAPAPLPPPRQKRRMNPNLKYVLFAVIIGAVALFAFTSLSDDGGSSTGGDDIEFDGETVDEPPTHSYNYTSATIDDPYSPGYKTVTIELGLKNLNHKDYRTNYFYIALLDGDDVIDPVTQDCDKPDEAMPIGAVAHYRAVFKIPSASADSVKMIFQGPLGIGVVVQLDRSISIR